MRAIEMSRTMRIGIDARELVARPTGVGRYLSELMARWTRAPSAAAHTLVLFAPAALPPEAGWRGTSGSAVEEVVVAGKGGSLWEQGALARAVRRARLDVFFAPGYTAPLLLRVPLVVAMHDVSFAAHPEWFRPREGLRLRVVAGATARRARRVLTLTRFSRDQIVEHLGVPASRIDIIPAAVDSHPALVGPEADGPVNEDGRHDRESDLVLFVGSIFTRRHVPELIDAFAALARRRPGCRLAIVGEDRTWPQQQIARHIASTDLADRIEWHRWLPEAALRTLQSRARVFAFLSEYEGFGLTPLEALRSGVPPVVADVEVAHEVYGEAAIYADPRHPARIAAALETALDDQGARARVLGAAGDVLRRYRWDEAAERTLSAITAAAGADR